MCACRHPPSYIRVCKHACLCLYVCVYVAEVRVLSVYVCCLSENVSRCLLYVLSTAVIACLSVSLYMSLRIYMCVSPFQSVRVFVCCGDRRLRLETVFVCLFVYLFFFYGEWHCLLTTIVARARVCVTDRQKDRRDESWKLIKRLTGERLFNWIVMYFNFYLVTSKKQMVIMMMIMRMIITIMMVMMKFL